MRILYEYRISPLQVVPVKDVIEGDTYITEEGHKVIALMDSEGEMFLEILKTSPLVEGEYMSGLTEKQQKLFWILIDK